MKKKMLFIVSIINEIIIIVCSIIIPNNPNKIIPSITGNFIDFPLWFDLILVYSFINFMLMAYIYEKKIINQ